MAPRYRIRVRGQVQGVGFRPFIWHLARECGVTGEVLNDGEGVLIRCEAEDIETFIARLRSEIPPLAQIDSVDVQCDPNAPAFTQFDIVATNVDDVHTYATPDARICTACLDEIDDPSERRFSYAFANCTHCGPRFSILESIPYDRTSTTMRVFALCDHCCSEYQDPSDRRFHAQPIACPICGPRLWYEDLNGPVEGDPITIATERLLRGEILAIKGLGGFHLCCDATDVSAVATLRKRKHRPAKPFAVMAPDIDTIRRFSMLNSAEAKLLSSPAAPIVLLQLAGEPLAESVAPEQWALGWMIPTTPLHHLLLKAVSRPLVMTSGNLSNEPQVIDNAEAKEKLNTIVDGFLFHDRAIARRLDDSVAKVIQGRSRLQRRARGYAPTTLRLPRCISGRSPVTAFGGQLKAAICLARDNQALLSHHLGDLDDALTAIEFDVALKDYAAIFDHQPELLACDLHPDYRSTRLAEEIAAQRDLPLEKVQHHHAHIASVMAEKRWNDEDGPVLGIALDGLGLGDDDTVWGGELLLCSYSEYERLGWLKPVPLPGGEAAQIEPWRNLLAQLDAAELEEEADRILSDYPLSTLRRMIAKSLNAPLTSSAGRLFDAVAAVLEISPAKQSFEGEAAMALETLARSADDTAGVYPFAFSGHVIDPAPMWRALFEDHRDGESNGVMARRFHLGLAKAITEAARSLASERGAAAIALSGGCFQNSLLLETCLANLGDFQVLTHATTPPNDGSLALGQAAVALARTGEISGK